MKHSKKLTSWGEAAAIHRDRSRERAHYEVGYFGRKGEGLVFYAMGGGSSLRTMTKPLCGIVNPVLGLR